MARLQENPPAEEVNIRVETTEQAPTEAEKPNKDEKPSLYECKGCNKTYKSKGGVTKHWKNDNNPCLEGVGMKEIFESEIAACSIPKITNIEVEKQIVKLITEDKKIDACLLYRQVTGRPMTDAVQTLAKFWKDECMKHIDTSKYPKNCCFNCCGACGNLKQLLIDYGEKLYDTNKSRAHGTSCSRFREKSYFEKRMWADLTSKTRGRITFEAMSSGGTTTVTFDEPFLTITKRNGIEERLLSKKEFRTQLSDVLIDYMVKKDQRFYRLNNSDKCLRKKGVEPKEGETWAEYVDRLSDEIRKIRSDSHDKIMAMTDEEVMKFIKEMLTKHGVKAVLEQWKDDFMGFLEAFYPEKDVKEIALHLSKEETR